MALPFIFVQVDKNNKLARREKNRSCYERKGKMRHAVSFPFYILGAHTMKRKKREDSFQSDLIEELQERYPNALITKFDGQQGWPDLLILEDNFWAMLECKRDEKAVHQPNQDYYVERMNKMSFSRFIFPENKEEVLNELEQALQAGRTTRASRGE